MGEWPGGVSAPRAVADTGRGADMPQGRTCTIVLPSGEICPRKHKAHGWCKQHYWRWQAKGDPLAEASFRRYGQQGCNIPECPRPHYAREWCRGHWEAWRRNGDPNVRLRALKGQADYYQEGYHHITIDGQIVREHRYVMEQRLGRRLLPGENVHHMNGIRGDNRPENLELWLEHGAQPKGQRARDLLAWAEEIVARYGPERDLL
jgi:hypothetical protein